MSKALFALGTIVATPGALMAVEIAQQTLTEFVQRHHSGDWGELDDEDRNENDYSLKNGFRLLSAYRLRDGVKIWIITEADRSVTTILLPGEY